MSDNFQPFEAEVGRVLDIVVNSLYKEREIFLRELISNASDACDKLRYESLSSPELLGEDPELKISIRADESHGILSITDNGIGMDRDDLVANLGTIARSGTARFLEQAGRDKSGSLNLIGQFGVGFYSVFMVADKIIVHSRKAGDQTSWIWASDGRSGFSVAEAEDTLPRGTSVTLHLKDDAKEFLGEYRLRHIVRTYSNHIAIPIMLDVVAKPGDTKTNREVEQINEASAIWTRPKSDISEDQYREFYHHVAHAFDEPYARIHFTAEGVLAYTALLYVPSQRPIDLFDPKRRHGVRLYVKRVYITNDLESLLPRYLRFVSGVVDSEDLQLNVSRETLQHGAIIAKMKKTLTKRLLDELARKAKEPEQDETAETDGEAKADLAAPSYVDIWRDFGPVLKEGLYEDNDNRATLLELARFKSTRGSELVSLEDYVATMKEGQADILYISGENAEAMRSSPQLEEARAKGVEVLLMEDAVDEFWLPQVEKYQDKAFKSLTKGSVDLSKVSSEETPEEKPDDEAKSDLDRLIAKIKVALGDEVKDVRASSRLRDSAVCLVADDDTGMDLRLERFLKQHSQIDSLTKRVLEINGRHDLIKRMSALAKDAGKGSEVTELARLLLDQARIIEGEPIPNPGAFSRRMSSFLAKGLAA